MIRTWPLLFAAALAIAAVAFFVLRGPHKAAPAAKAPLPRATQERRAADALYGKDRRGAEGKYESFVKRHAASRDPKVQDEVGKARIRLGYLAAKRGDFPAARATFLTAAREYRGTGRMGADFGGIPDQAAYQAAVCLVAEKKPQEAEREFRRFLKERPLSPLVHAAHRRLARLRGGDPNEEEDLLLQAAVAKQEKHIRFETSVCGPKTIAYLLERFPALRPQRPTPNAQRPDYKSLAKLCGTTDAGTTLEGMRKGLRAVGLPAFGLRVSRRDLARLPLPAILLEGDHYVALLSVRDREATVYDSRYATERKVPLPALDDPDFAATVLTLTPPQELNARS